MTSATPIDWLMTAAAGGILASLSAVALRWPRLGVSRIFVKLCASRGMSPRANLLLLLLLGLALVALGLAGPWIDQATAGL